MPEIKIFALPDAMRPQTCVECGGEATLIVQEVVPGGAFVFICEPCVP